ncbi:hypothetical protein ACSBR1_016925 [Camellia fascicularis]
MSKEAPTLQDRCRCCVRQRKPPDWQDFVGIITLLFINSTISFIEENNAGNAAAALMACLAPKAKVLRHGKWSEEDAAVLVPGDVVSIKLGDIIPADARLLEGDPLKIDQSALTGESLHVTKSPGDGVYSGSTCKQGEIEAVVIATSVHSFGKAAHLVDSTNQVGHFQKVLNAIGNFCICSIAVGMIIEIIVMYPVQHRPYRPGIDNLLVLLIGGIPTAMPTVLSVTMAIDSHRLAQQGAITKRMTAIKEMAGMGVLCSDKVFARGVDGEAVVLMAARASRVENQDAIDAAIVGTLADPKEARAGIQEVHFLPFNPTDNRTALTYIDGEERKVHAVIDKFAEQGLRSLALAYQDQSNGVSSLENVKCKLLHWEGTNLVVAEGQIASRDPKSKVHHVTLGPICWKSLSSPGGAPGQHSWGHKRKATIKDKCGNKRGYTMEVEEEEEETDDDELVSKT